jgi:hypothetical protein
MFILDSRQDADADRISVISESFRKYQEHPISHHLGRVYCGWKANMAAGNLAAVIRSLTPEEQESDQASDGLSGKVKRGGFQWT